jgi:hypothetical protein
MLEVKRFKCTKGGRKEKERRPFLTKGDRILCPTQKTPQVRFSYFELSINILNIFESTVVGFIVVKLSCCLHGTQAVNYVKKCPVHIFPSSFD